MKAATVYGQLLLLDLIISIHAAREGGDSVALPICYSHKVSIHAAREGGDRSASQSVQQSRVSIHAAREGGDGIRAKKHGFFHRFQSTPPVKAATQQELPSLLQGCVSIHAAREGGDLFFCA